MELTHQFGRMLYESLGLYDKVSMLTDAYGWLSDKMKEMSPEERRFTGIMTASAGAMIALKTAMAGYNLVSGIGAALSGQKTAALQAEAGAHNANTAALKAETGAVRELNAAKGANGSAMVAGTALVKIKIPRESAELDQNQREIVLANHQLKKAEAVRMEVRNKYDLARAEDQAAIAANRNAKIREALSKRKIMLEKQEKAAVEAKYLARAKSCLLMKQEKAIIEANKLVKSRLRMKEKIALHSNNNFLRKGSFEFNPSESILLEEMNVQAHEAAYVKSHKEANAAASSYEMSRAVYAKSQMEADAAASSYEMSRNDVLSINKETTVSTKQLEAAEAEYQARLRKRDQLVIRRTGIQKREEWGSSLKKTAEEQGINKPVAGVAAAQAGLARMNSLQEGKSLLDANAAASAAYAKALKLESLEASIAQKGEEMKNFALKTGATEAQANALKTQFMTKAQKDAALSATLHGKALMGVRTAANTAKVAALGLAKAFLPMLALSAAIAGIDYLLNRKSEAAEGASEVAAKNAEEARKTLEKNDAERASDREKLERWRELSEYSSRTAGEQQELIQLSGELNGKYKGLNLTIADQAKALGKTVEEYRKLQRIQEETQEKKREKELGDNLQTARDDYQKEYRKVIEKSDGILTRSATWLAFLSGSKQKTGFQFSQSLQSINPEDINVLNQYRNSVKKDVMGGRMSVENLEALDNIINKYKVLKKQRQALADFQNGKTSIHGEEALRQASINKDFEQYEDKIKDRKFNLTLGLVLPRNQIEMIDGKIQELQKKQREYAIPVHAGFGKTKLVAKNDPKSMKEYYNLESKIAALEGKKSGANMLIAKDEFARKIEQQKKVIELQKMDTGAGHRSREKIAKERYLDLYNEEIKKEREMAFDKSASDEERARHAKRLIDLTKERGELESQLDKENFQNLKENLQNLLEKEQAEKNFYRNLSSRANSFRSTAQEAVDARSEQAIQLQSRTFLSVPYKATEEAAKQTSLSAVRIASLVEKMEREASAQKQLLEDIKKALKPSPVGG